MTNIYRVIAILRCFEVSLSWGLGGLQKLVVHRPTSIALYTTSINRLTDTQVLEINNERPKHILVSSHTKICQNIRFSKL